MNIKIGMRDGFGQKGSISPFSLTVYEFHGDMNKIRGAVVCRLERVYGYKFEKYFRSELFTLFANCY